MPNPGYDHVDPPLPDKSGVQPDVKYILELYAHEIREHAAAVMYIYGLGLTEAQRYKTKVYEAAEQLEEASEILRQAVKRMGSPPKPAR